MLVGLGRLNYRRPVTAFDLASLRVFPRGDEHCTVGGLLDLDRELEARRYEAAHQFRDSTLSHTDLGSEVRLCFAGSSEMGFEISHAEDMTVRNIPVKYYIPAARLKAFPHSGNVSP